MTIIIFSASCTSIVAKEGLKTIPLKVSSHMITRYSPEGHKAHESHKAVSMSVLGDGADRVYLFVPTSPKLAKKAPIVFFHHGWLGWDPQNFGALIDHLVRSGNVVIYPSYQNFDKTPPNTVTHNAGNANRAALRQLKEQYGITPDTNKILYFGFSMGAAISLNLAQDYQKYDLPKPSALVLVGPGDAYHVLKGAQSIIKPLYKLPKDLPIVMMTGESDPIGLPTVNKLYPQVCHIQADRRVLMVLPSDVHLGRKVNAGHGSAGAPDSRYAFPLTRSQFPSIIQGRATFESSGSLNQLDFYGYWKAIEGVMDGLKTNTLSPVVFGNGNPVQLSLGHWPDGKAFKKIELKTLCP